MYNKVKDATGEVLVYVYRRKNVWVPGYKIMYAPTDSHSMFIFGSNFFEEGNVFLTEKQAIKFINVQVRISFIKNGWEESALYKKYLSSVSNTTIELWALLLILRKN